jgi:Tol biopolymer transport system component
MSSSGGFAWTRLGVLLLAAAVVPSCGGGNGSPAPAASSGAGGKASISQGGRFIVFETSSPGSGSQLVVVDRVNDTSAVIDGNDVSNASVSPDGRFVAFDAVPAGGGPRQVFLKDQTTGGVTLVSATPDGLSGNGDSTNPSVSDSGAFVAFQSKALNLGARSASSTSVLVRAVGTTTIRSASSPATGTDVSPAISGNGRFVAFESQPLSGSGFSTVLLFSQQSGQLTTVPQTPGGVPPDGPSGSPSINLDGRFVAFESRATNLVGTASPAVSFAGESNIFVRDVLSGLTVTASIPLRPGSPASGDSHHPSLSEDGTQVAFDSTATNLTADMVVPGESNVFVRNLSTQTTMLVTSPPSPSTTTPAAVTPTVPAPVPAAAPVTGTGAGLGTGMPVVPTGTGSSVGTGLPVVPTGTGSSVGTGLPVVPTGTGTASGTGPAVVPTGTATAAGSPVPTGTGTSLNTTPATPPTGNAAGLSTGTPVVSTGTGSGLGTTPVVPVTGNASGLGTGSPVVPTGTGGSSAGTPVPTGTATPPGGSLPVSPTPTGSFGGSTPVVPPGSGTGGLSAGGTLVTSTPVTTTGSASPFGPTTPVVSSMATLSTVAAVPAGSVRPGLSSDGAWVVFESRGQALAGVSDASGTHIFIADLRSRIISEIGLGSK